MLRPIHEIWQMAALGIWGMPDSWGCGRGQGSAEYLPPISTSSIMQGNLPATQGSTLCPGANESKEERKGWEIHEKKNKKVEDEIKNEKGLKEARDSKEMPIDLFGPLAPCRLYRSHSYFGSLVPRPPPIHLPGKPLRPGGCVTLNSCNRHTYTAQCFARQAFQTPPSTTKSLGSPPVTPSLRHSPKSVLAYITPREEEEEGTTFLMPESKSRSR